MALEWNRIDSFAGNRNSPALTSQRGCPVCGCRKAEEVWRLADYQFYSDSARLPKRVDLVQQRCRSCFALFQNPGYNSRGFRVLFSESGASYGAAAGRYQEMAKWLGRKGLLRQGSTLLDAGCYEGSFLSLLPSHLDRLGVDIDGPAIARARARHGRSGIRFEKGDFERFRPPRVPDVITMFHVLEHLPHPLGVLRNLRRISSSATRLVVEVPVLELSPLCDIVGFITPQHMTHFTRRSLLNLLLRSGWHPESEESVGGYGGYRVLAVPGDEGERLVPSTEDVEASHRFLSGWQRRVAEVEARLRPLEGEARAIVWGGGMHTEHLYHLTSFFRAVPGRRFLLLDADPLKQGKSWRGLAIHSPDNLAETASTGAPLLISSYSHQEAIFSDAIRRGFDRRRIVRLYPRVERY